MRIALVILWYSALWSTGSANTIDESVYPEWSECVRLCLHHDLHQTDVYMDCLQTCGHYTIDLSHWRPCITVYATAETQYDIHNERLIQIMKHKNIVQRMNTWEAQKLETHTLQVLRSVASFKEKLESVYDSMQQIIVANSIEEAEALLDTIKNPLENASHIAGPLSDSVVQISDEMGALEHNMGNTYELFVTIVQRRRNLIEFYTYLQGFFEDLYNSLLHGQPLQNCPMFVASDGSNVTGWKPIDIYLPPAPPPSTSHCPECPACPVVQCICPDCSTNECPETPECLRSLNVQRSLNAQRSQRQRTTRESSGCHRIS